MKIITQRQLIQSVAAKWRQQYKETIGVPLHDGTAKREVAKQLDDLDRNTASAEDVARIIGNNSWIQMTCDECNRDVTAVVRVGAELDYESATVHLCFDCVHEASQLEWPNDEKTN